VPIIVRARIIIDIDLGVILTLQLRTWLHKLGAVAGHNILDLVIRFLVNWLKVRLNWIFAIF
jgi:hypothetical protein